MAERVGPELQHERVHAVPQHGKDVSDAEHRLGQTLPGAQQGGLELCRHVHGLVAEPQPPRAAHLGVQCGEAGVALGTGKAVAAAEDLASAGGGTLRAASLAATQRARRPQMGGR